jgi:hypothetical protein
MTGVLWFSGQALTLPPMIERIEEIRRRCVRSWRTHPTVAIESQAHSWMGEQDIEATERLPRCRAFQQGGVSVRKRGMQFEQR